MSSQIILASSSPRRIEMLRSNGIEPIIIPSDVEEALPLEVSMEQSVMYLSLKKALNVEKFYLPEVINQSQPTVIIAADTIVFKNGIIGKPTNWNDAENTLKLLRNSNHFVATGVAFVSPSTEKRTVFCDITEVYFKDYSNEEIISYLNSEEPWDKAGSYAIQGDWGKYVSRIVGSYDNVIGFPWDRIKTELTKNWPEIKL